MFCFSAVPRTTDKQICLVGKVAEDSAVVEAAGTFGVPVVTSSTGIPSRFLSIKILPSNRTFFVGEEYLRKQTDITTVFVLDSFDGDIFDALYKAKQLVLGAPALRQLADRKEVLPNNTRPLFNLAMLGVVVCFTGFRSKEELVRE